jgi:integrase
MKGMLIKKFPGAGPGKVITKDFYMSETSRRRKPYREWRGNRLPPNVHVYYDRHGKLRNYYRLGKSKKPAFCPGVEPLTKEWWEGYAAARAGQPHVPAPAEKRRVLAGTFNALIAEYKRTEWRRLKPKTQHNYGVDLKWIARGWGDGPVADALPQHIHAWLSDKASGDGTKPPAPGAARTMWTTFSNLFKLAVSLDWRPDNPMRRVERPALPNKEGYRTALELDVARWRKRHADNPDALFVLNGLLATGARSRSDFRFLGWKNIENGVISFLPEKTRETTGEWVHLPIIDKHLLASLETRPKDQTYFLQTPDGQQWKDERLGRRFRRWADEAGWPKEAKMHGLRKLFATRMVNRGANELQVAAALGDTPQSVMTYVRRRNKKDLAAQAVALTADREVA